MDSKKEQLLGQISKIRASFVAALFIFIFNIQDILEYVDFRSISLPTSAYDELLILVATIICIIVFFLNRNPSSLEKIVRANRIFSALFLVMLLAEIFAIAVEWNTIQISDEPYMILFVSIGLLNSLWGNHKTKRFVFAAAISLFLLALFSAYLPLLAQNLPAQTLAQFLSANKKVSIANFSSFIEPRLDNVSMYNISYLTSGYATINGTKMGKNFSLSIRKFFDNYTMHDTDLAANTNSILLELATVNRSYKYATYLCSQSPFSYLLQNGTKIQKGQFICQKRANISVEGAAYSPFTDSLGLSGQNTTTTGGLYNISVVSSSVPYLGDTCTLVRSAYIVNTTYNISLQMKASYLAKGNLTQCISNKYYSVLFGRFVGHSNITYPKFNNGTMSILNLSNVYTFYQINATSINQKVSSLEFKGLPGPITEYPKK